MEAFTAPGSFSQQRLWFLDRMDPANPAYHVPVALALRGKIRRDAIESALNKIVERHEILRTTFASSEGKLLQVIVPAISVAVREETVADDRSMTAAIRDEIHGPFDLVRGPLLRAALLGRSDTEAVLVLTLHHIVADAWSLGVLVHEFEALYSEHVLGAALPLAELPIQFADYVDWQQRQQDGLGQQKEYWNERLRPPRSEASLPPDRPRPPVFSYRGTTHSLLVPRTTLDPLRRLAAQNEASLFMILVAALNLLLYRYTGQVDITIGSPIANRHRRELESLVGFFVNTQALRTDLSGDPSFLELLSRVKETCLGASANQDLPFERIVEMLAPQRDRSRSPLFQVVLALQNAPLDELRLPGLEVERLEVATETSKFDLTVQAEERNHELHLTLEYSTDLYHAETIDAFGRRFAKVLEEIGKRPQGKLDQVPLVTSSEREALLAWSGEGTRYPVEENLWSWFSSMAAARPEAIALSGDGREWTYGTLAAQATRLAHALRSRGVGPETFVGLAIDRSPSLVVAILGVLQAGGAYVPLDPAYPAERLAFMVEDSGLELLITDGSATIPEISGLDIFDLAAEADVLGHESAAPLAPIPGADHAAYVIYTSGSTGRPKGVVVTHANVVRLLRASEDCFDFGSEDVWTLFHSSAFDFSVWEIWGSLLYGGRLIVVPYELTRTPERFYALLADEGVTVLNQTPSAFRQLLAVDERERRSLSLRYVVFGGEALDFGILEPWVERHGDEAPQLVNMYGITETTVHVTYRRLRREDIARAHGSLIGRPLGDLKLHVLDRCQDLAPVGVPGELYVGGAGLARGYLGQPALTASRFLPDPFDSGRLYRTGDRARRLPNGDLEYLGRLDAQVKLRGFRIETGEIETVLRERGGLADAVVLIRPHPSGEPHLVAYTTTADGAARSPSELRDQCRAWLPDHMIPAAFVFLDRWPLTPNGKLDRQALPLPDLEQATAPQSHAPPETEAEIALAAVWASVLGVEKVGVEDNFFQRGGDSILSLQVVAKAARSSWHITPRQLFETGNLRELAAVATPIESASIALGADTSSTRYELAGLDDDALFGLIGSGEGVEDLYPLSPMQEGMLFHALSAPESRLYLEQLHSVMHGQVDPDAFEKAWRRVIQRHPVLRTSFVWDEGTLLQRVDERVDFSLERLDWSDLAPERRDTELAYWLEQDRARGLDLARAPLMRVTLIRLDETTWRWIWTHHHSLLDGWSLPLLMREVLLAYRAAVDGRPLELPAVRPYRDYIEWLRRQDPDRAEAYWREALAGFSEPTTLRVGPKPAAEQAGHGEADLVLTAEETQALDHWARRHQLTLNTLVTGAWTRLLHTYSGRTDVVFGVTVSGRPPDLDGAGQMLGLFINTLPFRPPPAGGGKQLVEWLHSIQESQVALREVEYSRLVDIHAATDIPTGQPIFETLLAFENYPIESALGDDFSDLGMGPITFVERMNYSLGLAAIPGERLTLRILFDTSTFALDSVEAILRQLHELLRAVALGRVERADQWRLLTAGEFLEQSAWFTNETSKPQALFHRQFETQVARTPEASAVESDGLTISYDELNQRANRLARYLRDRGIGPDIPVGVCMERSPETIVALLAILKAGGAYLPIDPSLPSHRMKAVLRAASPRLVLVREGQAERLRHLGSEVLLVDREAVAIEEEAAGNLEPTPEPANLAYLIFTSGSTGEPKGVMVHHLGLANLAVAQSRAFEVDAESRVFQFAALTFDASLSEIAMTLCAGATLLLSTESNLLPDASFLRLLRERRCSHITLPPSILARMPAEPLPDLRYLIVAGEACPAELMARHASERVFFNAYGPTETSVCATLGRCRDDTSIGRPLENMEAFVLDPHGTPAPEGVEGELYIGGIGLARGYARQPGQTAERFVPHPFGDQPGARLYRSGDLARFLPGGRLEFLGRIDHQVKLRGFRIEPGEIEHVLREQAGFKEAVVVVRGEEQRDPRLVAYGVPGSPQATPAEARRHCEQWLPSYSIPSSFVLLEELPLTSSGKVDRAALPEADLDAAAVRAAYTAPRTEAERALAAAWSTAIGVSQLGIHDNFFALGGDSILTLQVVGLAQQAGWKITPRQLFEFPTISRLAEVAEQRASAGVAPETHDGGVPLTPIQKWFFEQPLQNRHQWNQAVLVNTDPSVSADMLGEAFARIARRHDALRLRFENRQESWLQKLDSGPGEIAFEVEPLDVERRDEQVNRVAADAHARLHLTTGPLARAVYLDGGANRPGLLFVVIHHLVVDGVSWRILLEDLEHLCFQIATGEELKPPPLTATFAEWARSLAREAGGLPASEFEYWLSLPVEEVVPLPRDGEFSGANEAVTLERELDAEYTSALLDRVPAAYRTQINDLLLAALHGAVSRWSSAPHVYLDLEGHGREEIVDGIDITRTVGWFTSIFPVLLKARPDDSPRTLIRSIKDQLREIPRKGVTFGIGRYLGPDALSESLASLPDPEISFNYLGQLDQGAGSRLFTLADHRPGRGGQEDEPRSHLLDIVARIESKRLRIEWTFDRQCHRQETIERVADDFVTGLRELIDHCLAPEAGGVTASDFSLAGLDNDALFGLIGSGEGVEDLYPLSPMQEGMLFHALSAPESRLYLEQLHGLMHGPVDPDAFEKSWRRVIQRHPVLRTAFVRDEGTLLQRVDAQVDFALESLDWSDLAPDRRSAELADWLEQDRARGLDLARAPLMRVTLIRLDETTWRWIWTHHHSLLDGWSLPLLMREVLLAYRAAVDGRPLELPAVRPYRDYIEWLRRQDPDRAEAYWREVLAGFSEPTTLRVGPKPAAEQAGHGEADLALTAEETQALDHWARRHQLTLNTLVTGAWTRLLHTYSGRTDVVFGVTVSGRPPDLDGADQMLGLFINTLPFRPPPAGGGNQLVDWLHSIQEGQVALREVEYSRLVDIHAATDIPAGQPIFETLLAFDNYPVDRAIDPDLVDFSLSDIHLDERTNYPLTLSVVPGTQMRFKMLFDGRRFDSQSAHRALAALRHLLVSVAETRVSSVEQWRLSPAGNSPLASLSPADASPASEDCLHLRFARSAASHSERTAVSCGDDRLNYGELEIRANRLAHHLKAKGVGPETRVGICLERSTDLVVSILAVLKAGAAYVPLDPAYPPQRLEFLIEDSGARILVTERPLVEELASAEAMDPVYLDEEVSEIAARPSSPPDSKTVADNAAYVIYTSGSTGTPKGCVVSHRNAMRLMSQTEDWFGFDESDVWTLFHSYSFDFSVWEIWGALLYGGQLVIVPYLISRSPEQFYDLLQDCRVTVLNQTPSAFRQLMAADAGRSSPHNLSALRFVILGGEALQLDTLEDWFGRRGDRSPKIVNMYGITETTVHVTYRPVSLADVRAGRGSVIGDAIPDLCLEVLDVFGQPAPDGVAGELFVGGGGVARGYLDRPALTSERFVPNPDGPGRLYRTGDLARRLPEGGFEYLGRQDDQVKIRGFRIELGEIESNLMRHDGIREAVALTVGDKSTPSVVAYVVPRDEAAESLTVSALRSFLDQHLPDYMVPGAFVLLGSLPLTEQGKVDRSALCEMAVGNLEPEETYVAPRSEIEAALAAIWQEVLEVDRVGVHDNFFALGGDSIRSIQIEAKARAQGLPFDLTTLFTRPTIAALAVAEVADARATARLAPFELISDDDRARLPASIEDAYPPVELQKGMVFHSEFEAGSSAYQDILSYHLRVPWNREALSAAIGWLVDRHAILRASFAVAGYSHPLLLIHRDLEPHLTFEDLRHLDDPAQREHIREWIDEHSSRPFPVDEPPLIEFHACRRSENRAQFTLKVHHAILDGWSVASMLTELFERYLELMGIGNGPAAAPGIEFRDFVALELAALESAEDRSFWQRTLADAAFVPLPRLSPTDSGRRIQRRDLEIPAATASALKQLAGECGIPLRSLLLAAHVRVLGAVTNTRDVITGLVSNSRPESDGGDRVLGLFLNTLPFRIRLDGGSWRELSREVFRTEQAMMPHRRFPLRQMQQLAGLGKLFETDFNFVNFHVFERLAASGKIEYLDGESLEDTNFVLAADFAWDGRTKELRARLSFDASVLGEDQIDRLSGYYERALKAMAADFDQDYEQRSVIGSAEATQLRAMAFGGTLEVSSEEAALHDLVAEQALESPDRPAVSDQSTTLSYAELERRANQLAHYLLRHGASPDRPVGICLESSASRVVALLGALKAGGSYLPLDPEYPDERLAFMIEDAGAALVITESEIAARLPEGMAGLSLSAEWQQIERQPAQAPHVVVSPDQLAYVLYTSGSTGRPKGVQITHRSIVNHMNWMSAAFPLEEEDRVLQKTPFTFDASVWEFWAPLMSGARLVAAQPGGHRDPAYLVRAIQEGRTTVLQVVPTLLAELLREPGFASSTSLRRVFVGGEALTSQMAADFARQLPDVPLVNLYGPTEATVDTSFHVCRSDGYRDGVPIGRPIANVSMFVLDAWGNLAPLGTVGELMVGGVGLARGYRRRPGLTAGAFVPAPSDPGARLYRTGDLARCLPNGDFEYWGRVDGQVKFRGFRIELLEIEAALETHPGVRQAAVSVEPGKNSRPSLVAHLLRAPQTAAAEKLLDATALRRYLRRHLPDYMVPTGYLFLEAFPRTPSGKIDRRSLPPVGATFDDSARDQTPPRNELEALMVRIWSALLGMESIGIHDNFFDLGGDSILSLQIVSNMREEGWVVTPRLIFDKGSIAAISPLVVAVEEKATTPEATGAVALTPIQHSFFDLDLADPNHWNQATLLEVPADFSPVSFQDALTAVVRHHDAFRLRFERSDVGWTQLYDDRPGDVECLSIDFSGLDDAQRKRQLASLANMLHSSLDLSIGPLVQSAFCSYGADRPGRILIVVHHLVVDGVSWRILFQDLAAAYEQIRNDEPVRLPVATDSYQSWSNALQDYAGSDPLSEELSYWLAPERSAPARLPDDHEERGENLEADSDSVRIELGRSQTRELLSILGTDSLRVEEALLTAVSRAVQEWTGSPVSVALEGHGREDIFEGLDVSRTVGWFTSLYPLDLDTDTGPALDATAKTASRLRSVPHRGVGYGVLRYLSPDPEVRRQLASLPQPEISFNYLGQLDLGLPASGPFRPASEGVGQERSPRARRRYAFDVVAFLFDGKIQLEWLFGSKRHRKETVETLARSAAAFLEEMAGIAAESTKSTEDTQPLEGREGVADIAPLTSLQEGLLFHALDDQQPGVYVQQMVANVSGTIDQRAFQTAWETVIASHSIFRTGFERPELGSPAQVVHSSVGFSVDWLDWRAHSAEQRRREWLDLIEGDRARGFHLDAPPLMRVTVAREADLSWRLLWTHHHLILDGWSLPIVLQEIMASYGQAVAGGAPELKEAKPFADYARWLERQDHGAAEAYWRKTLRGFTEPLEVNLDGPSGTASHGFGEERLTLSPDLTRRLTELAQAHRLTLNTVVQGLWALLSSRYGETSDVLFGVTVSGRPASLPEAQRMVGPFINTLPLRLDASGDLPAIDFLAEVQRRQSELSEFEFSRLVDVLGWSEMPRTKSLFESILVFENYPLGEGIAAETEAGFRVDSMETLERAHYPLSFLVAPGPSADGSGRLLALRLVYQKSRFGAVGIQRFLRHFRRLAESLADSSQVRLSELSMLTTEERSQVMNGWNATHGEHDPRPVHERVADRAATCPEAVAVSCGGERLSYGELDRRSTALASYLLELGVGPERPVAVCIERSLEMVVALLGVLKTGAPYVPLDPAFPQRRLAWMIENSQAALLLTAGDIGNSVDGYAGRVVRLDSDWTKIEAAETSGRLPSIDPDDLAYIIYTSGSTGRPKGVAVRHGGLTNFLCDFERRSGIHQEDTMVSVTTLSFDIAGLELYLPLISGASLVVAEAETAADGDRLAALLHESSATILQATPATWRLLISVGWSPSAGLRVWCGGEALPRDLAEALLSGSPRTLWNLYGPTETTIWSTLHELSDAEENSCIGRPIANTATYVVDETFQLVAPGMEGELLIGGSGLARGYWSQPGATAERFVPDPFGPLDGGRLYRTGDRVRQSTGGQFEFVGRLDSQRKLRGFRIELGEIESVLRSHDSVADAAVELRQVAGADHLVAYLISFDSEGLEPRLESALRAYLSDQLPGYMIPSFFVLLPELPLTPNRKLDRKRLPAPDMEAAREAREYVEPRTALERLLTNLWEDTLETDRVGIQDDFFRLGGHSLLAAQMLSWLRRVFRQEFPIRMLFDATTVGKLAEAISSVESEPGISERTAQTLLEIRAMSPDERAALKKARGQGTKAETRRP